VILSALMLACSGGYPARPLPNVSGSPDLGEPTEPTVGGDSDTAPEGASELRGVWVTRWTYGSAEEVETILGEIADAGFNTVLFQVRGNFDAFYDSELEPWSKLLGPLGADPGWDPLAVAVASGHDLGLEIHAYINVFPFWQGAEAPSSEGLSHPYTDHPEWVVADESGAAMALNDSYIFASPGNPDVRAHVAAVAADITGKYDVDGVHLDYIRYPQPYYSYDAASEDGFPGGDRAEWQREQVRLAVSAVSETVDVPVTAAVWGVYENIWGWSGVSQGNTDYYQDSFSFLERGLLDANMPMIYWPVTETEGDRLDFKTLARHHQDNAGGRHVYPGISAEHGLDAAVACVEAAREVGNAGVVLFDYSVARDWLKTFGERVFSEPASVPQMPWRE